VLDKVGTKTCGNLCHPEQIIKGKEDAANDDAHGYIPKYGLVGGGVLHVALREE
jgi:hypothetical protein